MFTTLIARASPTKPFWMARAFKVLDRLKVGRLTVVMPDQTEHNFVGSVSGPAAKIEIHTYQLFPHLFLNGEIGFAESFMKGDWTSPDLQDLLDLVVANSSYIRDGFKATRANAVVERIRHWLRSNTKSQSRRNIAHHYDLGNDFYALWLDESMTYSAGLFGDDNIGLEQSHARKYDAIATSIGAGGQSNILEIGCGWGGFAEHIAKTRGSNVTALTISRAQHAFAQQRIFEAGLNEKVDIVLRDYREENGKYDGIASIEMFEAVGEKQWPTYFEIVRNRLNEGAFASVQTITIADELFEPYTKKVDFIQKYIFPGGMLPSQAAFLKSANENGLDVTNTMAFGQGYSKTLRLWAEQFNARWPQIEAMGFDERFRRMWTYYLAACAASFRYETTSVAQFTLKKS